jgi:hypothetical protein
LKEKYSMAQPSLAVAVVQRLALVNGNFPLPDETPATVKKIREIVAQCATDLAAAINVVPHDIGRFIATLDLLQQAKDVACCAVLLPHAPRAVT